MSWTHVQVDAMIDLYRNHPCLYAVRNARYHNKQARHDALTSIALDLEYIRPSSTPADIKHKFSNLRTTYVAEKRKTERSLLSACAPDEVYKANLWYYSKLQFLDEHMTPRSPKHDMTETIFELGSSDDLTMSIKQEDSSSDVHEDHSTNESIQLNIAPKRLKISTDEIMTNCSTGVIKFTDSKPIEETNSECEQFGRLVAIKLETLSDYEKTIVMHKIDNIFYEIRLSKFKE